MQQGLMFFGSIIGLRHFKWAATQTRTAGEMLSIFVCEKTDDGSLESQPLTISVPSEAISAVMAKMHTVKQFDLFGCILNVIPSKNPQQPPRYQFVKFITIPGAK